MRLLVHLFRWTGWVPRLHPNCLSLAISERMELGAIRTRRAARLGSRGLGQEPNGSLYSRHLLPNSAIRPVANLKKGLNAQEYRSFPLVRPAV
jgi:hypothetical protein